MGTESRIAAHFMIMTTVEMHEIVSLISHTRGIHYDSWHDCSCTSYGDKITGNDECKKTQDLNKMHCCIETTLLVPAQSAYKATGD